MFTGPEISIENKSQRQHVDAVEYNVYQVGADRDCV